MHQQLFDITIIGGGIVGMATAYKIQKNRPDLRLLILEKEDALASHQSGHNSGVLHFEIRNLIYPVPNLDFPFLGVHFTRTINGDIECGPNAAFTFKREGYGKTDFNLEDTLNAYVTQFWRGRRL